MITIDLKDKRPLYLQVIEGIEDLILKGVLAPNEQLPSVRSLAMELSINPNTIQRAYLELEKRDITYSIAGRGSFVNENNDALELEKYKRLLVALKELVKTAKDLQFSFEELEVKIKEFYFGKEGEV